MGWIKPENHLTLLSLKSDTLALKTLKVMYSSMMRTVTTVRKRSQITVNRDYLAFEQDVFLVKSTS